MQGSNQKVLFLAINFFDENGELTVSIGDMVQVALETVEDGFGETKLSREKAKRAESWKMLRKLMSHKKLSLA